MKLLLIVILLFLFDMSAYCGEQVNSSNHKDSEIIKIGSKQEIPITTSTDFSVCAAKSKCVYPYEVFDNLYKGIPYRYSVVDNIVLLPSVATIASIIASFKFFDGKYLYAIFLVQNNKIDSEGKFEDCHICSPALGVIVYQFHNQWEVFSKQPFLSKAEIGSWGQIRLRTGDIKIIPLGIANFLMQIHVGGFAQGRSFNNIGIVRVGHDGINKNDGGIQYLGLIRTGEVGPGFEEKDGCDDWEGDVKYDTSTNPPLIYITKKFYTGCQDETKGSDSIVMKYVFDDAIGEYKNGIQNGTK